jgi:hypothetical protein
MCLMSNEFEVSWEKWKTIYKKYRNGYNKDIWSEISQHPLDRIIDELGQIYLASSSRQRIIVDEALNSGYIEQWDLALYIRRVGLRLPLEKNEKMIDWAFLITLILYKFVDPRDLIVSLILMAVGAKKAGINIEDNLEAAQLTTNKHVMDLLTNALHQSEVSINITIKMFGPPEWKNNNSQ